MLTERRKSAIQTFMPNLDYWDCLHDGTITAAAGSVPGNVELTIDCEYILEELHPSPGFLRLQITNCTRFEIDVGGIGTPRDGFEVLATAELEIVDAEMIEGGVKIYSDTGILWLRYETELLMLDDGTIVSLSTLVDAADRAVGDD